MYYVYLTSKILGEASYMIMIYLIDREASKTVDFMTQLGCI